MSAHFPPASSGPVVPETPLMQGFAPRTERRAELAPLGGSGPPIETSHCVEPGTDLAVVLMLIGLALVWIVLLVTIWGFLIGLVMIAAGWLARRRARAVLRGSALRVGPHQFPTLHDCATQFARRLGLAETPELYVVDAGEVNGFALRFGKSSAILLTDETVAACMEGGSPGALAFVLGHEMGHLALGHQRWWRRPLKQLHWLARLDECSADNVACELVGSQEAAEDGILLLCAGPRLLSLVDRDAARRQAAEVVQDAATKRAERVLTHPLAMRRLDRVAKRFGAWRRAA